MAVFIFKRQRQYPTLDMEVGLNLKRYSNLDYVAHAWLKAKGATGDRAKWRDDFWAWAEDRELDAYSPRYGNRRDDRTSAFDCHLKTWQVVADFIVQWIGTETLSAALIEADEAQALKDEMTGLSRSVRALTEEVASLRASIGTQQHAMRTVGLALLQAPGGLLPNHSSRDAA